MDYQSRSEQGGCKEYVRDHLNDVESLAATFAAAWGGVAEAQIAGLLHDLGKYGDKFQALLRGKDKHVDHWTAGANMALRQYRDDSLAAVLAVQGHHIGLQTAEMDPLLAALQQADKPSPNASRQWAGNPTEELFQRWQADAGFVLPETIDSKFRRDQAWPVTAMLDVRMLFSALVDADWLSAEAHEHRDEHGPRLREPV